MNVEVDTTKTEAKAPSKEPVKPTNPATVKKAVALGKALAAAQNPPGMAT